MRAVSRHHFAPWLTLEQAYEDSALPILGSSEAAPATISQPAAIAIMLEGFSLARGQRVLEIGAGTGYNAALMAHVNGEEGRVVTVDIEGWLVEAALERLESAGFGRVRVVHGDGGLGFPESAPYDRIVATVGAWDIPPAWRDQLAEGGRIVVPLHVGGEPHEHLLASLEREGDHLAGRFLAPLGMVVMRGEHAAPEGEPPSRAGADWRPSDPGELRLKVYPRGSGYEPLPNEKVIEKGSSLVVLARSP